MTIGMGDVLVFKYSTDQDVWMHSSQASLDACDHSAGVQLAGKDDGGGCTDDGDLTCIAQSTGFEWTASQPGDYYFSCSVGTHCTAGQRLVVHVVDASSPMPPLPRNVSVPYWTDDAGYCGPILGLDEHVHRPTGLTPMTLVHGQALLLKYSKWHDVWAHTSLATLEACDYTGAVMLAGRAEGGGCAYDGDLACIDASRGTELALAPGDVYLSCSVHDHCGNGQRLVVHVLPVSPVPPEQASDEDDAPAAPADSSPQLRHALELVVGGAVGGGVVAICLLIARCATHRTAPMLKVGGDGRSDDPAHARHGV